MLNLVYELLFHDATFAISSEKSLNIVSLPHLPLHLFAHHYYIHIGVFLLQCCFSQLYFVLSMKMHDNHNLNLKLTVSYTLLDILSTGNYVAYRLDAVCVVTKTNSFLTREPIPVIS